MIVTLNDFNTSLKSALNSNDPSVAIAADNDLDGVFSAILLDLGLYKLFDIEVETYFRDELRWEIPIDQEFDILIMVDLAYDNTPNYRRAANQARQSYAIDHHVTSEKGFPKRVVMYNPCKDGQCYLPATYLVYEVITELGVKTEPFYEYMNLLGILADAGINFIVNQDAKIEYFFDPKLKNIFEKSRVHFDYLFEQKSYDGLIYPYFKEKIEALSFEGAEGGWKELYLRFINEVNNLSTAQELVRKILRKNNQEFFNVVQQVPKKPTETTKSGIWLINNTSSIGNGIIGRIIAELIGKPVVAYSCKKFCRVSARAPSDSDINFIPMFSGFGGGHPKACGAFLTQNQFQSLLVRIKEM